MSDRAKEENLRVEYTSISNYFNSLITHRLTLLGFFLAAIGLIIRGEWPFPLHISIIGLFLTISMYIFELRTRVLFHHIANRAIEIEQDDWGFKNKGVKPFFTLQFQNTTIEHKHVEPVKIFAKICLPKSRIISHSVSLDFLYISLLILFISTIIFSKEMRFGFVWLFTNLN